MDYESKGPDDLTVKVNYVRDWLNKAEDAIRRGDRIDAVAKLALAKADATNLMSSLIPAPRAEKRYRRVHLPSASLRKFSLLIAPFVFIGVFMLGVTVGEGNMPPNIAPDLNISPGNAIVRTVERQSPDNGLVAMSPLNAPPVEQSTKILTTPPAPRPKVRTVPVSHEEPVAATEEVVSEPDEAATVSEEDAATVEEPIDIFGLGMDVIRSARENLSR